jgi:glycosyltransferase involved in cell wall biosynthesis
VTASVIIPARNAAATIAVQLEALAEQDFAGRFEVIVVDDASSDDTSRIASEFAGRLELRVHRLPDPSGPNRARNAGARLARGRCLLFCDADDRADRLWVGALVGALVDVDAVGGRVELDTLNLPSTAARHRPWVFETGLDRGPLASPIGTNCGVRKEVWAALRGFDESLGYQQGNETEFFWRLQLAGYWLAFVPTAVMAYRLRRSLRVNLARQFRYGYARRRLQHGYRACLAIPLASPESQSAVRQVGGPAWILGHIAWLLGVLAGRLAPDRSWQPLPFTLRSDVAPEAIEISVIVPAFQAADTIGQQLESLARQAFRGAWEVIVVDDASTDHTSSIAQSYRDRLPGLRVIRRPLRGGANAARNLGAAVARGTSLVFCDADDEADEGWLAAMAAGLADADGIGGRIDLDRLNSPRMAARRRPFAYESGLTIDPSLPLSPIGANCGVRRDVWKALGGFDEHLRWGGDDETDFYWRLQFASYTLTYADEAVMGYRLRTQLGALLRQQYRWGYSRRQLIRAYGRNSSSLGVSSEKLGRRAPTPTNLLSDLAWWIGQLAGQLVPDRTWRPITPVDRSA